jgi:hypothetical protein
MLRAKSAGKIAAEDVSKLRGWRGYLMAVDRPCLSRLVAYSKKRARRLGIEPLEGFSG